MPLLLLACSTAVPTNAGSTVAAGTLSKYTLSVNDPDARLGSVERHFDVAVPWDYAPRGDNLSAVAEGGGGASYPLLIYFHGQYGYASYAQGFGTLGAKKGFITLAPQGLGDGFPFDLDTTWSVRAEGRTDVCDRVIPQWVMKSCRTVGRVSPCNWATCYDDVHYVKSLLVALVVAGVPIDPNRLYISGASNGGIFADYLASQLPGVFAAAVPWYGAFLRDYLAPANLTGTSLLSAHGLEDKVIPAGGGESSQHYYYVSQAAQLGAWAEANGCDAAATNVSTPFDGEGRPAMEHWCAEHQRCATGSVMICRFPKQAHGFWPSFAERLTWWFASKRALDGGAGTDAERRARLMARLE